MRWPCCFDLYTWLEAVDIGFDNFNPGRRERSFILDSPMVSHAHMVHSCALGSNYTPLRWLGLPNIAESIRVTGRSIYLKNKICGLHEQELYLTLTVRLHVRPELKQKSRT